MSALQALSFGLRSRLPLILQTEAAECGLASLAMIASYHGHRLDIGAMRRRFSASLKGMTLYQLVDLAGRLSLTTRAVRVDVSEFRDLRCPCILHWDFGHFVVLDRVTRKGAIIHDPSRGRRHVPAEEIDRKFTGVALEVWPAETFARQTERERFRILRLFRQAVGLKRALAQIFAIALCLEVFALLAPLGMQVIVDQAIVSADMELVTLVLIGLGLLLVLQILFGIVQSWGVMVLMTRLGLQWDTSLFTHLMRLPLAWFEKRHVGDIVSRFGALAVIQRTLTTDLVASVLDAMMAAGMLGAMLLYSPGLTLISVTVFLAYGCVRLAFYPAYRTAAETELVYRAREDTHFMESIRGVISIKALGLEDERRTGWLQSLVDALNADLKTNKLDIVFSTVNGILFGAGRIALLWFGARSVIQGSLSIGMLLAFTAYQEQFVARVSGLVGMLFSLRMLSLHGERLSDIAHEAPEEAGTNGATALRVSEPVTLELKELRFRYGDGEPEIVRDVDLRVEGAECVAIVGPSGCGKTTVIKLAAGLLPPSGGHVAMNGHDIRALGLRAYRQSIGCVLQDDRLFAGTIAENIAGFGHQADQGWIEECAHLAAIALDIRRMPMGYETLVGDMGSTLSGGQKQRVVLARALYRRPSILFLDEASSHLDEDTEAAINAHLRDLCIPRVIVAHRPNTIALADRVVEMAGGRLAASSRNPERKMTCVY